jgi:hypothetical protein
MSIRQSKKAEWWATRLILFLDAPGPYWGVGPSSQCSTGTSFIDSETDILDFQVTFTSKLFNYQRTAFYYTKIVVAPGGTTDFTNSKADYGNLPLPQ